MSVARGYYDLAKVSWLTDALYQRVLPDILEESRSINNVESVQKLWEVPLDFKDKLSIYFHCSLIGKIFLFCTFHVDDYSYLINSFLIDEFFAISEFVSPSVFQFLNEEMDKDIYRLDTFHQF